MQGSQAAIRGERAMSIGEEVYRGSDFAENIHTIQRESSKGKKATRKREQGGAEVFNNRRIRD